MKRAIDLDLVELKRPEIAQAGIAGCRKSSIDRRTPSSRSLLQHAERVGAVCRAAPFSVSSSSSRDDDSPVAASALMTVDSRRRLRNCREDTFDGDPQTGWPGRRFLTSLAQHPFADLKDETGPSSASGMKRFGRPPKP